MNNINKSNFIEYLNKEISYECHTIIFNILKMYNISFTQNNNGIFIDYDQLNDNIIDIIINYINDYIKKKKINHNLQYKQNQINKYKNIDTHFYIPLTDDEINIFKKFQELILQHNFKKYQRPPIIKKTYNCKSINNNLFENNCYTLILDNYLL